MLGTLIGVEKLTNTSPDIDMLLIWALNSSFVLKDIVVLGFLLDSLLIVLFEFPIGFSTLALLMLIRKDTIVDLEFGWSSVKVIYIVKSP